MVKLGLLALLFFLVTASSGFSNDNICDSTPVSNDFLCGHMIHLRSHVKVLDSQRDLLQLNYPFLESLGSGIAQLVIRIEKFGSRPEDHLEDLHYVKEQADQLSLQAKDHLPAALATANQIQVQCLRCHAQQNPSSGRNWEDLTKNGWNYIVSKCNSPLEGRNPYACKQMHGLLSLVEFFETADKGLNRSFEAYAMNAQEVVRIADDLLEKKMLHGSSSGAGGLQEVRSLGMLIKDLAETRDDEIFPTIKRLAKSCQNCHAAP